MFLLIHYHEIALKKGNRRFFVDKLCENVRFALKDAGGIKDIKIEKLPGRLLLQLNEVEPHSIEVLEKIPGIANFLPVFETGDLGSLKKKLVTELKTKKFGSFRISTQRGDKNFLKTSEEINREIGAFVQEETGAKVDLENPEFTVFIEMVVKRIFFGFKKFQGTGGLPVGSSGKVVSLLSGGIDSPVASFMMMKRGCKVVFVHFHAFPYLDNSSQEKAKELVSLLSKHQGRSKLYTVSFGDIQKEIVLKSPEQYRVIIYRRLMMRIAEEIARKEKAGALVTGESLGQVASQTLENISVIEKAIGLSVLRPLVGLCKEEIIKTARKISTYEISIRSDQDCCQLFMPKHPATKSDIKIIEEVESKIDINRLIDKIEYSKIDF